jgi:hypothetical protein
MGVLFSIARPRMSNCCTRDTALAQPLLKTRCNSSPVFTPSARLDRQTVYERIL